MPNESFYRLNEAKQARIKAALKEEIAGYSYEDFSINRIVRSCGISRGSFYQYFKNRDDIYIYLVSDYNRLIVEHAEACIREKDGSFFDMLK
ncbi:MAG: TetR/AcrR family transcriptional regulator, partial [Oscillospiraceae bacterium]|nr:TetR/AcrR family transcriptional regulator [Oscillospiraceae bacterium]